MPVGAIPTVAERPEVVVRLAKMFAKRQAFVACDKLTSRTCESRRSHAATESCPKYRERNYPEKVRACAFALWSRVVPGKLGRVWCGRCSLARAPK